jgi:catechol 2,3-dioxygenase-like lactoylglutathione lyase family enzyme
MFTSVFATASVRDLRTAEVFYRRLFGAGPDARPMDGLLEWHLPQGAAVQVFEDPARAGGGSFVLTSDDLEAEVRRLREAGIACGDPESGGGSRVLPLADPDGNRIVLFGP